MSTPPTPVRPSSTARGPILVTGGTGYIAAHCIAHALSRGEAVRATVRSLDRADLLRAQVDVTGQDGSAVEVVAADLTHDEGWAEAVAGCSGVFHVASPLPHGEPKAPEDVIRPAREGTLRVLRAARDAGVPRVVLTSAFGAVGCGRGPSAHTFTEKDWSPIESPGMSVHHRSKTLAERDAWEFVRTEGRGLELVTLCPTAVFGPLLGRSVSGGNEVIRRLLAGKMPGTVDMWFPVVDVRDVATAHRAALRTPEAAGERFILGSGEGLTMGQIAQLLRDELGGAAAEVTTRSIPTWLVRGIARVVPSARSVAFELGSSKDIDVSRAREVLGFPRRPAAESVLASARSMIERGIVPADTTSVGRN